MQKVSLMVKVLPEHQQIFNFFIDLGYQHCRCSLPPRNILQICEVDQVDIHETHPCIDR